MKIYTKTGDDGTTSLFDGTRVKKSDERVAVYGDVDELNSILGLAVTQVLSKEFKTELITIQRDLFALGAQLANPTQRQLKEKAEFGTQKILLLESRIDFMESCLKPLTAFILPGGSLASASLQVCRSVARRAERHLVAMNDDSLLLVYLNRLSDYFFVAARYANWLENISDVPWE